MKSISQYCEQLKAIQIVGTIPESHTGVTDNSRNVQEGSIFIAYSGPLRDGHAFIPDAIAAGATVIVLDNPEFLSSCADVCAILVPDSKTALLDIAWWWYDNPTGGMIIVGVTGTNGKTTVASSVFSIWRNLGIHAGLISTVEHKIDETVLPSNNTTPGVIELAQLFFGMRQAGVTHVVMEVSSHALDQRRAEKIPFTVAAFTNLTQDHLDYHHTMENYAAAKQLLFTGLSADATAVVNCDDTYHTTMIRDCRARIVTVGQSDQSSVRLSDIHLSASKSIFALSGIQFSTPLLGMFNVYNIALVIEVMRATGIDDEKIISAVRGLSAPRGRAQLVHPHNPAVIVDYAHTPDGVSKILDMAREISEGHDVVVVFGCGGDRDPGKRPIMGSIAAEKADYVVVTSDNPRTEDPDIIIEQIVGGIPAESRNRTTTIPDRRAAIEYAIAHYPNALIVIAGKGHEDYQIIGTTKHHFDDVEVVREILK